MSDAPDGAGRRPRIDRRMLEFLVCPVTRGRLVYDAGAAGAGLEGRRARLPDPRRHPGDAGRRGAPARRLRRRREAASSRLRPPRRLAAPRSRRAARGTSSYADAVHARHEVRRMRRFIGIFACSTEIVEISSRFQRRCAGAAAPRPACVDTRRNGRVPREAAARGRCVSLATDAVSATMARALGPFQSAPPSRRAISRAVAVEDDGDRQAGHVHRARRARPSGRGRSASAVMPASALKRGDGLGAVAAGGDRRSPRSRRRRGRAASASSAGISSRQGAHQVAQKLTRRTVPFEAASVVSAAVGVGEGDVGRRRPASAWTTSLRMSPSRSASIAARCVGGQVRGRGGVCEGARARRIAGPAARQAARTGGRHGRQDAVPTRCGAAASPRAGRGDGGDQRLDRLRQAAGAPRTSRRAAPMPPCSAPPASSADSDARGDPGRPAHGACQRSRPAASPFSTALEDIHMNVESRLRS